MRAAGNDRQEFIAYPTNRVVGTINDAAKAKAAIDALLSAGFDRKDIDLLHSEEDLRRLGAEHGFLAQFQRTLIRTFDFEEFTHLAHHIEDVRAGRFVLMVLTKRRALRIVAADILHQHGAEFVGFYGRWAWEELPPTAHASPEEIPALFAQAWNNRDADALASMFDEDAGFVSATGLCWNDRQSIRNGHATALGKVVNGAALAVSDTKVKLLSPEVAVVCARMNLSDQKPGDGGTSPEARTIIVSFVLHRAGDRWRCALAHNTDVVPGLAPNVADDLGTQRLASPSGNQLS